jgi:hypothetical protein
MNIALDDQAMWYLARYNEAKAELSRAATDKEKAHWREESRSYAVDFTFYVLMVHPDVAQAAAEVPA